MSPPHWIYPQKTFKRRLKYLYLFSVPIHFQINHRHSTAVWKKKHIFLCFTKIHFVHFVNMKTEQFWLQSGVPRRFWDDMMVTRGRWWWQLVGTEVVWCGRPREVQRSLSLLSQFDSSSGPQPKIYGPVSSSLIPHREGHLHWTLGGV